MSTTPLRLPPGAVLESPGETAQPMRLPPGAVLESGTVPHQPSTYERLTAPIDPGTEAFAEKHPVLGVPARFLSSAGAAAMGLPGSIYKAFTDPLTPEEEQNFQGHTRIPGEVILERLMGAEGAPQALHDWVSGKVTPRAALSVTPELAGQAAGTAAAAGAAGEGLSRAPGAVRAVTPYAGPVARAGFKALDAVTFDRIGKLWNAYKGLSEELRAKSLVFQNPGGPLPETPPPELLQARSLSAGAQITSVPASALRRVPVPANPPVYPGASLPAVPAPEVLNPSLVSPTRTLPGQIGPEVIRPPAQPIPARWGLMLPGEVESAPLPSAPEPSAPRPLNLEAPRVISGESALRQVLGGQDNANLLKIAKSRGINVTREAQLKPGVANGLIINKIVDHFSADELQEIQAQYMENTRFRHAFGDIGPEAWKTMSLQTYFPDLKIPAVQLARTTKAISKGDIATPGSPVSPQSPPPTVEGDLTSLLQESVKRVRKAQGRE